MQLLHKSMKRSLILFTAQSNSETKRVPRGETEKWNWAVRNCIPIFCKRLHFNCPNIICDWFFCVFVDWRPAIWLHSSWFETTWSFWLVQEERSSGKLSKRWWMSSNPRRDVESCNRCWKCNKHSRPNSWFCTPQWWGESFQLRTVGYFLWKLFPLLGTYQEYVASV